MSQIATFLFSIFLLSGSVALSQVVGFYHKQNTPVEDEILPSTAAVFGDESLEPGIDFKEWDKDLQKSIRRAERKCQGKNCNFKLRQALEPSSDF